MPSLPPSIGARQCLRLRPRSSARLDCKSTSASMQPSLVTPVPSAARTISRYTSRSFRTNASQLQAVQVAHRPHESPVTSSQQAQSLSDIVRRVQSVVDPTQQALGGEWINRMDRLVQKVQRLEAAGDRGPDCNRVLVVGSSLSQTQQLLNAMIDEPLREMGGSQNNQAQAYAPGHSQPLDSHTVGLDRHWLQQANLEITVLLDPSPSEATYDLIYDSEAVLFVTDDYALSRSAHRSRSAGERGDTTHELLSRFAAKPNVHLVVNSILGSDLAQIADGLEAATGSSVSELVAPSLIPVRISDALAANAALRQALEKTEQPIASPVADSTPSTAYWDNFSSHYQRSNVGTLLNLIQTLQARQGSQALLAQSSAFLLQHCLDEALAIAKRNLAYLHQLRSLASEAKEREQIVLKQSLERIWPPTTAYTGQLSSDEIKVWRPASPGSHSAVDQAMQQTDALFESTFDSKLQWWKLIWKVDDVRKELESACSGFAASLESDLAYESGRLATLQLVQQLGPSLSSASRDVILLTNEAEAYRSSKLRTIEPSTLMEPIHRRRAQLLQTGGPIDVLASKSRKLAVTNSAAVAVTAAGVGSASVLGASLTGIDASSAALALDPSTGIGLGLLTLTLVGWRMQGQYNKYRRQFRDDWQRFSQGLDQDLKLDYQSSTTEEYVRSIAAPNTTSSSTTSTAQKIIDKSL
ncbi:uncharacterized protein UTRI_02529 [Ustilago trichophora]|uniref:Mmc1 C-terminal domain-containing protein n=1 Tax=Ustilago trichophora TaxID=86804 RepID=A0A5C3E6C4_9BASI|nr:uncharacterized protein UTRI_02529 [Ustilago trichophora]